MESLFDLPHEKKKKFLASLGMTIFWRGFFRSLFSLLQLTFFWNLNQTG